MLRSLRFGFATNSSSSHSIVLLHPSQRSMHGLSDDGVDHAKYAEYFTVSKMESKLAYAIWAHQRAGMLDTSAHATMRLLGTFQRFLPMEAEAVAALVTAEDHESGYPIPDMLCPKGIDPALWILFLATGHVSLHGYSTEEISPLDAARDSERFVADMEGLTFRQDGQAIVAYDPTNGFKFRWSPLPYNKSTVPELVDLKITDRCGWGCRFCYQGSTEGGQHAPFERLTAAIDAFARGGVFEIAVGGGEPVDHPRFADLLAHAAARKITLNFTTYGVAWAASSTPILQAMKTTRWAGGVGVSVHSVADLAKVERLRDDLSRHGLTDAQVLAQTVVGVLPMEATQAILEACIAQDVPLLLLGYKTTGRGAAFPRKDADREAVQRMLETAQAAVESPSTRDAYGCAVHRRFTLSVDTAFLDAHGGVLDALGVPSVLRTSPEGKFSMYVDAVTNTAAPSSYAPPSAFVPWNPDDLAGIFAPL